MKFLSSIVKKHKLSTKEKKELDKKIELTLKKINQELDKNKIKAKAILGGSAAKGTLIQEDFDVDVFVKFNYSYKDQNISDLLEKALKQFKAQRVQGSRNYFQFTSEKINYEVVPVLTVRSYKEALNVTDASPLHVDWVKRRVKKKPRLLDEIILTKVFLKANKLYGAESYINGFSGHVVDILTLNYKGFLPLLKACQKWKKQEVIDPEKHKTFRELNKSKLGALVIIDPVQPNRNAAAALSYANFLRFKQVASEFLKNPCEKFFEKEIITIEKLKKKANENKLLVLEVVPLKGKKDVVGAKLLKAFDYISKQIKKNDFIIIDKGWELDKKAIFWYIVDPEIPPMHKEHMGPPLKHKAHVKAFEKQYSHTYVKNKRVFAKVKRKYRRAEKLIQDLIKEEYVKERVKKIIN